MILLATLSLLVIGHDKLFTSPLGRIPDGVIENRKATKDDIVTGKQIGRAHV